MFRHITKFSNQINKINNVSKFGLVNHLLMNKPMRFCTKTQKSQTISEILDGMTIVTPNQHKHTQKINEFILNSCREIEKSEDMQCLLYTEFVDNTKLTSLTDSLEHISMESLMKKYQ